MSISPWTMMAVLISSGAQLVVFLRWMHRRMRDDEIQRAFVRALAKEHLPRIYAALRLIATQQGIALDEAPIVQYVEFPNGRGRN
jgi:hypothetical protein